MPAYNVADYIAETLESICAQSYQAFEIIVVNDGSPDTPALEAALTPFRNRIRYLVQQNKGPSAARNTGLRAASGSFIATLDGDDIWLPHYLQTQLNFLSEHPGYSLVYCNAEFFGDSPEAGIVYMNLCPSRGEADFDALIRRDCHVFTSITARREVFDTTGFFDESLRFCEDFDYWVRVTLAGFRIGYHREILVRYRKRGGSLSTNVVRMCESSIAAHRKALLAVEAGSKSAQTVSAALSRIEAELHVLQGKQALSAGDTAAAIDRLSQANRHYKSAKLTLVTTSLRFAPSLVRRLYLGRSRQLAETRLNPS